MLAQLLEIKRIMYKPDIFLIIAVWFQTVESRLSRQLADYPAGQQNSTRIV